MALAERLLAAQFNRPGHAIVDHRTYVFVRRRLPDGRHLARGVLARRHARPRQADRASTTTTASRSTARRKGWFTDDTPKRFEAYGWHVIADVDGHDVDAVDRGDPRRAARHRPAHAHLLQDDHRQGRAAQGRAPPKRTARALGDKEVALTRAALGWTLSAVRDPRRGLRRLERARARRSGGGCVGEALRRVSRSASPTSPPNSRGGCTASCPRRGTRRPARSSPRKMRRPKPSRRARPRSRRSRPTRRRCPELLGGSADLTRFGVHELVRQQSGHPRRSRATTSTSACANSAMCAIANGLALHGGYIPYVGTFLTFSDYCAQRAADGGADEAALDLRVHPRFDRAGRGRADAPVGRARGEPAAHSAHGRLAPLRHGRDRRRVGGGDRARGRPDRASCSRGRTWRSRRAMPRRSRRSAAAATCSPTGMARARSAR